jgi:ribosomal protein L40E
MLQNKASKVCLKCGGKLKSIAPFFFLSNGNGISLTPRELEVCQKCGHPFEAEKA